MIVQPSTTSEGQHLSMANAMFYVFLTMQMLSNTGDAMQKSLAQLNELEASNIETLANADETQQTADEKALQTFYAEHKDDKDSQGNPIIGQEMADQEQIYANDKKAMQNEMDRQTTLTTLYSNSVQTVDSASSYESTAEQQFMQTEYTLTRLTAQWGG